jgi:hypothetical protein
MENMNVSLHIVYESDVGSPLTVGKTNNPDLLIQTANTIATEAFERAELIRDSDEFLGEIQKEEAERLQRVLQTLLPQYKCEFSSDEHFQKEVK